MQRLLDFGLPKLVFTVIDNKEMLRVVATSPDILRVLEAEALSLQEKWGEVETSLELGAFQDVRSECHRCRLLGEAKFRLSKFDEANFYLGSLLHADSAFIMPTSTGGPDKSTTVGASQSAAAMVF